MKGEDAGIVVTGSAGGSAETDGFMLGCRRGSWAFVEDSAGELSDGTDAGRSVEGVGDGTGRLLDGIDAGGSRLAVDEGAAIVGSAIVWAGVTGAGVDPAAAELVV